MRILGEENPIHGEAWDDRVAGGLGTAYYKVGLKEYELWQKRGFRLKKEDFDLSVDGQTDEFHEWQCINEGSKDR